MRVERRWNYKIIVRVQVSDNNYMDGTKIIESKVVIITIKL